MVRLRRADETRFRAIHRWLSAIACFRSLAWMVSELFFAAVPKERVMGPSGRGVPPVAFDPRVRPRAERARESGRPEDAA